MAKKTERIGLRTAEALVEGDDAYLCAEPEIVIGELDRSGLPARMALPSR